MSAFDDFLALIYAVEGTTLDLTYADSGNWTGGRVGAGQLRGSKCGISAAAYPTLDIANLDDRQIAAIYRLDYWAKIAGDSLPHGVALIAGDEAVNQGVGAASRDLQTALGVEADGVIGPATVAAAQRQANAPDELLIDVIARRAMRYVAAGNFAVFGLGWMRRLAHAAGAAFRAT